LNKKNKKLLSMASGIQFKRESRMLTAMEKSFLILLFKKEMLPSSA